MVGFSSVRSAVGQLVLRWLLSRPWTLQGVGLQDRALFQERVDYTLTNQSDGDFHGQVLTNTSFAGAVGRGADFSGADLQAIFTQGAFAEADFSDADLSDSLMDRAISAAPISPMRF